jgi:hypothetical protein
VVWACDGRLELRANPRSDRADPKRLIGGHQAAYELVYGAVPEGQLVRHRCHVHLCCNPAHLVAGTALENSADSREAGRLTGYRAHRRRRQEVAA